MTGPITPLNGPHNEEPTDVELVARYRHDGDTEAMSALIRRYERPLRFMAWRVMGNKEDAADVVQTTWVNVLTALARPEFAQWGNVRGWLYCIARNDAIDRLRRAHARLSVAMPPDFDAPANGDAFTAADARMIIERLLDEVPSAQREAIVLVWLRGLSVNEAAEVLDIPVGTVKSRCKRARAAMASAVSRGGAITTALDPE